ncbi:GNAT family N-acetyltransferase [Streptomyces catenulae]|uniref:GNAT family N-acetyltransferase n=1 Tax=Streptomyces catenulae TaxID=66875 RepID=A0ABV2Z000_9ACTN|nr:GNAT family N-acetyltransferase [Streptomyces catenulae]
MTTADGAPVRVREMTEGDAGAVAAVRVRGWQVAYEGLMPRAYLDGLSVPEQAAAQRVRLRRRSPAVRDLVAERAGAVVGWACVGPAPAPDATDRPAPEVPGTAPDPVGELFALYVAPELIGMGIGRTLMTASLEHAREAGFAELRLWVVRGNARARRFYARAGFTPDGTEQTDEVGGEPVPELRYRRPVG